MPLEENILNRVNTWLGESYDETTRNEIRKKLAEDPLSLADAFYCDLEFGTGGMRGKMGPGTNRMNIYTVGMATQGLANYLLKMFSGLKPVKTVISFDCRHNSRLFAETAANVLSANGIQVYLFDSLRPTPELSFAIRYLGCQGGIMVTASHNPKEYNGYKVYWDDGAQLIPPHDENVIDEVRNISGIENVKFQGNAELIHSIGPDIDAKYLEAVSKMSMSEPAGLKPDIAVVYTPLHGTGGRLVPSALKLFGLTNVHLVEEQMEENGDFPTAKSPNPEEAVALELAVKKAKEVNADLVMANDPDADRVGIAVKDQHGQFILLNGNQTGAILLDYVLSQRQRNQLQGKNDYIVTTIVTSDLIKEVASHYGVKAYEVLTGFKWIAGIVREKEGREDFVLGLEESFGYMIGDFIRDKDAVTASALIAQMAAVAAKDNITLFDMLINVYIKYGYYLEGLVSVSKEGKSGAEEIKNMMMQFRNNPPDQIAGSRLVKVADYLSLEEKDLLKQVTNKINLPASNVLQFFTEDGSKISIRPSGTEPKIKFYFSVTDKLASRDEYELKTLQLKEKVRRISESLAL